MTRPAVTAFLFLSVLVVAMLAGGHALDAVLADLRVRP